LSETSLNRMRDAAQKLRAKNQSEIADLIEECATDIQSSHRALQTETQALLQATAPALLKNAEDTLKSCETKLAEMTANFEKYSEDVMRLKLGQMDLEMAQRVSEVKLAERLIKTVQSVPPRNLKATARQILMEEAGPIWTQRWMITLGAIMIATLLMLGLILYSAQKAKSQIEHRTAELQALQQQINAEKVTLANMQSQTMGITFYKTKDGMALKLPETLRMRKASADVRNALGNTSRRNLYLIRER